MAHDGFPDQVLEVRRSAFDEAELHELPDTTLADGQIRLRIERFAVTANNVSYAGAGDLLGYWDFFPSDTDPQTWGRVPAMGWAQIVESRHPDLAVGGRYYGWFPMATTVVFSATATADGFRDDGAHRAAHLPIYRSYVAADRDPYYDAAPDGEDRHAVLRVLFLTGYLADEFFADGSGGDAVLRCAAGRRAVGVVQDRHRLRAARRANGRASRWWASPRPPTPTSCGRWASTTR